MLNNYFQEINKYFKLEYVFSYKDFIEFYARKRNFIMTNSQPDINRAQEALFDEFVNGKICKLNYEN